MRWLAVVLIALIVGLAGGIAGGYGYTRAHDKPSSTGSDVYCYDPNGPVHLNGTAQKQVCIPTGR